MQTKELKFPVAIQVNNKLSGFLELNDIQANMITDKELSELAIKMIDSENIDLEKTEVIKRPTSIKYFTK